MSGESFYKPSPMLDAMTGKRIPGGCDDCDAYQTMREEAPGVYVLQVSHDETCPFYRQARARREGGAS